MFTSVCILYSVWLILFNINMTPSTINSHFSTVMTTLSDSSEVFCFCSLQHIQHVQINCLWQSSISLFPAITDIITCLATTLAERHTPPSYELICQQPDRGVPPPLLLIAALRQLLKWEREIRWGGGMRYHKLNWDLICDGISKHPLCSAQVTLWEVWALHLGKQLLSACANNS